MFNRYFSPYFGSYKLDEINGEIAKGYWPWRMNYWKEGGAGFSQRKKHRDAGETPSNKTLKMERSALKQIFDDAVVVGWIRIAPTTALPPALRKPDGARPGFTTHEWNTLTSNIDNWCEAKGRFKKDKLNSRHRAERWLLRHHVLFMANTGLRVGEARELRWEDVKEFTDADDDEQKLEIKVRANTKTGARTVISQPNAVKYLSAVREMSDFTNPQDYVFASSTGKARVDFNKTFTKLLERIEYKDRDGGLLFDRDGKKRTLYSLRHFYATARIELGDVSLPLLAANMGTSYTQLEKHYLHLDVKRQSSKVTKKIKRSPRVAKGKTELEDIVALVESGSNEEALRKLKRMAASKRD